MSIGETVKITEGPLAGLVGRLAAFLEQRAVLVVELQGRQVDVELETAWIAPAIPRRKTAGSFRDPDAQRWSRA